MPYDTYFFNAYREYLKEPRVREVHDSMLRLLGDYLVPRNLAVLDLGCGVGEFVHFVSPLFYTYFGIDQERRGSHCSLIGDYTQLTYGQGVPTFEPNCFISLFSAECCLPFAQKYQLYERLFASLPSIRCALVSGFYYRNRADQERVQEPGGIESYQSIENPHMCESLWFIELRREVEVPSKMFGDDVIEVWKFLVRR